MADICARLPQGMLSLTVLLVVAQHASMRVAGLALAGSAVGLAVTAPLRGRLADRYGVTWIAALCCAAFIPAALGLLAAALARQPAALLIALATAMGFVMPHSARDCGSCGPFRPLPSYCRRHLRSTLPCSTSPISPAPSSPVPLP